jgi:hypothetical protein
MSMAAVGTLGPDLDVLVEEPVLDHPRLARGGGTADPEVP